MAIYVTTANDVARPAACLLSNKRCSRPAFRLHRRLIASRRYMPAASSKAPCCHVSIGPITFIKTTHYFVVGSELKCTGYDGRVLRGLKSQTVSPITVTLLDNVESFQIQFGVSDEIMTSQGQAISYVTGDQLANLRASNQLVVSLRWALMLKSYQNEVRQTTAQKFALLNEAAKTMDTAHYYQVFSKTLALRNMKNFVRSSR